MRFFNPTFSLWCIVFEALQAFGQAPSSKSLVLTPEVDAFINDLLTEWNSPGGVSVAVVRKTGDTSWNIETKGYGVAKADGANITENTLFAIGSNSKLFSILSAGLLISNQSLHPRISWKTKIASVIPEWGLMDHIATVDASIIDLMSHRTGLPRHDYVYTLNDEVPDLIKRFRFLKPSTEFRETWQYNNNMYTVLSYLPTALLLSRPKFARYVKESIFEPLGLNSTTYSFDVANQTGNLADGMARQRLNSSASAFDAGIPRALPFWSQIGGEDGNSLSGAGGIISNAIDMATWLQVLLLGGRNPHTNVSVIPPEVIDMVSTGITVAQDPFQLPFLSPSVYGGGQIQNAYRGHVIVEHDGSVPGFMSDVARLPFDGIGLAILSNDDWLGTFINLVIKYRLIDQALGLPPLDTKSIISEIITAFVGGAHTPIQRLENAAPPSGGFARLGGIYEDPGYGRIELCLATPSSASATVSPACRYLLTNTSTVLPGAIDPKVPTLLAKWNRPFGAYARMTHFNGNIFNLSMLDSYPTGNASQPFWTSGLGTTGPLVEFDQDGGKLGFGITGGVWGAGVGVLEPSGKNVRERSEIWFTKV